MLTITRCHSRKSKKAGRIVNSVFVNGHDNYRQSLQYLTYST